MSREASELLPPRVAIVDDERQIHASIRLRIGQNCELISFFDPRLALEAVAREKFDLCIVDKRSTIRPCNQNNAYIIQINV